MKKFTKAALVADALCLGPHWVYDQDSIARLYPNGVTSFSNPASQYHGTKKAGDQTHTGDQLFYLHQCIEQNGGSFSLDAWKAFWVEQMSSYNGYLDGATKATLNTGAQSPSQSEEVAGAVRCAPILDLDLSLEDSLLAATSQTRLTHGGLSVIELTEFIIRSAFAIKGGKSFKEAFYQAAEEGIYNSLNPLSHIQAAEEASKENHLSTASSFGLACHFSDAFPLALYYALNFSDSFEHCTSQNALAGGDNTARGIMLAIFFAARDGDVGAGLAPKLAIS